MQTFLAAAELAHQHAQHPPDLTRFDAALPFLAGAVFAFVGWLTSLVVLDRVKSTLHEWLQNSEDRPTDLPYTFQPDSLRRVSHWAVDTAQLLPGVLAPGLGVLLLVRQGATEVLIGAYVALVAFAFGIWVYYLRSAPDRYSTGWPRVLLTPVTFIIMMGNLAAALAAAIIGP